MAHSIFLNPQGIIECQVIGDQTPESVQDMGRELEGLVAQVQAEHKPRLILDDLTRMGQVPPAARKYVVSLAKSLAYDRLAMLGQNGLLRFGANLIIRASGRGHKMQYFINRNQAIAWLTAER